MAKDSIGSLWVDLRLGLAEFEDGLDKARKSLKKTGRDFTELGKSLSLSVTAPIVGFGAAAIAAGLKFDDAFDTIRAKTGATGQALKNLEKDFTATFKQVPQSAGEVTAAISTLNQKLGLSGPPLQDLAKNLLDVSRLMKEDVAGATEAVASTFVQWGVAAANQSKTLDFLFTVTQKTGVGMTALNSQLASSGPIFRELGFSVEDAAVFIGSLSKAGIDAGGVMAALKKSVSTLIGKGGVSDAGEALRVLGQSIKNAGSDTQATQLALKIFGERAGPQMARLIREGIVSLDDLAAQMGDTSDAVKNAVKDTDGAAESFGKLKNQVTAALAPIGLQILTIAEKAIPALEAFIAVVTKLAEWISRLPVPVQAALIGFLALSAAAGPIIAGYGLVAKTLASLIPLFTKLIPLITAANVALGTSGLAGGLGAAAAAATAFGIALAAIVIPAGLIYLVNEWSSKLEDTTDKWAMLSAGFDGSASSWNTAAVQMKKATDTVASSQNNLASSHAAVTASTKGVAQEFKGAGTAGKGLGVDVDALLAKMSGGKGKVDEFAKRVASLKESFAQSLNPAKELAVDIQILLDAGFSKHQIVAVWGDRILESAAATERLNGTLPDAVKNLKAMAIAMKLAGLAPKDFGQRPFGDFDIGDMSLVEAHIQTLTHPDLKGLKDLNAQLKDFRDESLKMPTWSTGVINSVKGIDEAIERNREAVKRNAEAAAQWRQAWANAMGQVVADFSEGVVDMITSGKNLASTLTGIFSNLGKTLLRLFIQELFSPLLQKFAEFGAGLANWLGGLFGKKGIGGAVAGVFGAATTTAVAGGVSGGAAGAAGATGAAAGAGAGGLGASTMAFLTNPITIAVGAGLAAAFAGVKIYQHMRAPISLAKKEIERDFSGLKIGGFNEFLASIELTEEKFKSIRKDITSSPKFFQDMLAPAAKTKEQVDALVASFGKLEAFGKTHDLSSAARQAVESGDYTKLNAQWLELFGTSEKLKEMMPDFANQLLAGSEAAKVNGKMVTEMMAQWSEFRNERPQQVSDELNAMAVAIDQISAKGGTAVQIYQLFGDKIVGLVKEAQKLKIVLPEAFAKFGASTFLPAQMLEQWEAFKRIPGEVAQEMEAMAAGIVLLTEKGATAQEIFELFGETIKALIEQAKKLGVAIPEALMRISGAAAGMGAQYSGGHFIGSSAGMTQAQIDASRSKPTIDPSGSGRPFENPFYEPPSLDTGGIVTQSGMGMVHEGEMFSSGVEPPQVNISMPISFNVQSDSENLVATVKGQVFPLLKQELQTNATGLAAEVGRSMKRWGG